LYAVAKNVESLHWVSKEIRNDKEVVLKTLAQNYESFLYASKELRNDKEVVLTVFAKLKLNKN